MAPAGRIPAPVIGVVYSPDAVVFTPDFPSLGATTAYRLEFF